MNFHRLPKINESNRATKPEVHLKRNNHSKISVVTARFAEIILIPLGFYAS